jgi:aminoglycoside phosphotransferase (APT) family kinase protein
MPASDPHPDQVHIDATLVRRLIRAQFPQWAELDIRPVEYDGWDNRSFRLGDDMTVRLPSAEGYVAQVEKEHRWLPRLAPCLPLPIPVPLAKGVPAGEYPWPWSIYRWLEGEIASVAHIDDLRQFATALAHFLSALQAIDATDGPPAGPHSFYRGAPLAVYDPETRKAIAALDGRIDTGATLAVWETAIQTMWHGAPVWFHGDMAAGNLLVDDGQLCAVIDFGCSGVGDPACDLAIAWTLFAGDSRDGLYTALPLDEATWARGRGWALWKVVITLAEHMHRDPTTAETARRVIDEVLTDHANAR